jgi:hypothetical protein
MGPASPAPGSGGPRAAKRHEDPRGWAGEAEGQPRSGWAGAAPPTPGALSLAASEAVVFAEFWSRFVLTFSF